MRARARTCAPRGRGAGLRDPPERPRGVRGSALTNKKSPGPKGPGLLRTVCVGGVGFPRDGVPWRHQCAGGPYEDATSAELLS